MRNLIAAGCIACISLISINSLGEASLSERMPTEVQAGGSGQQALTYEQLMAMSLQQRKQQFRDMTPSQRAEMMRTHLRRALASNLPRFTPEQRGAVEESLAAIRDDLFTVPPSPEAASQLKAMQSRAAELFAPDDRVQIFTLDGQAYPAPGRD